MSNQAGSVANSRPANSIVLAPALHRSLFPTATASADVFVLPTSFGARQPTLPTARTITLARIATTTGVDKRYERAWLKGLQSYFDPKLRNGEDDSRRLVKRGDVISIPVWIDKPIASDETLENAEGEDSEEAEPHVPTDLAYFIVTALSYEPLVPLDQDFRSSISSKARAGELGCWVDVGEKGETRMVLTGLERSRVARRAADKSWADLCELSSTGLRCSLHLSKHYPLLPSIRPHRHAYDSFSRRHSPNHLLRACYSSLFLSKALVDLASQCWSSP